MNGYEAMRDWYKGRIAELEAENAALKEEVKEQDEREARWAKRFDQQIGHYAVRLYNSRKRRILIARRRISALRKENAALREDKARLENAISLLHELYGLAIHRGILTSRHDERIGTFLRSLDAARKEAPDDEA